MEYRKGCYDKEFIWHNRFYNPFEGNSITLFTDILCDSPCKEIRF